MPVPIKFILGKSIYTKVFTLPMESDLDKFIKPIAYRPFDNRLIFYHDSLVWRTVKKIMLHMLPGNNIGLITARSNKSSTADHFFCTRFMMETKCGEATTQSALFPLYLRFPNENGRLMPNLNKNFIAILTEQLNINFTPNLEGDLNNTVSPEQIFNYIYAVFHSPTFRTRYLEFLKIDFPRVPLTSNLKLFKEMSCFGKRLVKIHLMENVKERLPITYSGISNEIIEKVEYNDGKVFINKEYYFEHVPLNVWNFSVGGYQICLKWLKDRKSRMLTQEDIIHYKKIIWVIDETITLMAQIDKCIEENGGWPIQ